MTKSIYYPPADRTKQWWEDAFPRGTFNVIEKIMMHTTETTSWPTYGDGSIAPTLTYKVTTREWRQHNRLNSSSRALGDPASTPVRENRDNAIQIEIIWYSKDIASLPDSAYRDLAAFVAFVREEWGGPSLNYAKVGGPNDNVHMSSDQYDAFNGILGHANAPSPSTHWDPGKMDYAKIVKYVQEIEGGPAPVPAAPVGDFTVAQINDVDTKLTQILSEVKGLRSEEKNRYVYYAGKFNSIEALAKNLTTELAAVEAVLQGDTDVEAFKAAAQTAFENALQSTLKVTVDSTATPPTV